LYRFWITRQRFAVGAVWFDRVLASPGGDERLRGRAFLNAGFMPFWMGDDVRASRLFERALVTGRRLGDASLTSGALGGLARVALRTDVAEVGGRREALPSHDAGDEADAQAPISSGSALRSRATCRGTRMMTQRSLVRATGSRFPIASRPPTSMVSARSGSWAQRSLAREALEIGSGPRTSSRRHSHQWVGGNRYGRGEFGVPRPRRRRGDHGGAEKARPTNGRTTNDSSRRSRSMGSKGSRAPGAAGMR
jgi:hypothetical protein